MSEDKLDMEEGKHNRERNDENIDCFSCLDEEEMEIKETVRKDT